MLFQDSNLVCLALGLYSVASRTPTFLWLCRAQDSLCASLISPKQKCFQRINAQLCHKVVLSSSGHRPAFWVYLSSHEKLPEEASCSVGILAWCPPASCSPSFHASREPYSGKWWTPKSVWQIFNPLSNGNLLLEVVLTGDSCRNSVSIPLWALAAFSPMASVHSGY